MFFSRRLETGVFKQGGCFSSVGGFLGVYVLIFLGGNFVCSLVLLVGGMSCIGTKPS